MKKILKLFGLSILFTALFTGCFSPVYDYVNKDVPPLSGSILGTIRAVTRYTIDEKEFLVVVSNDGIMYKSAEDEYYGAWKKYTALPDFEPHHFDYYGTYSHIGEQMLITHADSDTLYLFTVSYENDNMEGTTVPNGLYVYAKKIALAEDGSWSSDGEWTQIISKDSEINYFPIYKNKDYYYTAFSVFSTNSPQKAHRKVYLRCGDPDADDENYRTVSYYEFSGLNAPVAITATAADYADEEKDCINSAVYFDNQVVFFNSIASTTNETYSEDASVLYYSYDKNIYYKTLADSEFTKSEFSTGQYVSTLCTCKDALIIGRGQFNSGSNSPTGGVVQTTLDENGIIGSELTTFSSNIETQLRTSYYILCMLNTTPEKSEEDSSLYASIDFSSTGASTSVKFYEVGLWSYYKDRGNWNRE